MVFRKIVRDECPPIGVEKKGVFFAEFLDRHLKLRMRHLDAASFDVALHLGAVKGPEKIELSGQRRIWQRPLNARTIHRSAKRFAAEPSIRKIFEAKKLFDVKSKFHLFLAKPAVPEMINPRSNAFSEAVSTAGLSG